jgi:hypothetical protein
MKAILLFLLLAIICSCTNHSTVKDSVRVKDYKGKILVYKEVVIESGNFVYKETFRSHDSIYTENFATDLFYLFNEGDTIK